LYQDTLRITAGKTQKEGGCFAGGAGYTYPWSLPDPTAYFKRVASLNKQYLLRRILVYQPKDLNRDWSPRFSTLRDKNGWIRAQTA
jgi:hypothetical protein